MLAGWGAVPEHLKVTEPKRGVKQPITEDQRQAIASDNRPAKVIAVEYGLSASRVNQVKREVNGVPQRPAGRRLTDNEVKQIYTSDLYNNELAKMYGVSTDAIYSIKRGINHREITQGLTRDGQSNVSPRCNLSVSDLIKIYHSDLSCAKLSELFNAGRNTIWRIKRGEIYGEITGAKHGQ
jgi:hypothetical protein